MNWCNGRYLPRSTALAWKQLILGSSFWWWLGNMSNCLLFIEATPNLWQYNHVFNLKTYFLPYSMVRQQKQFKVIKVKVRENYEGWPRESLFYTSLPCHLKNDCFILLNSQGCIISNMKNSFVTILLD